MMKKQFGFTEVDRLQLINTNCGNVMSTWIQQGNVSLLTKNVLLNQMLLNVNHYAEAILIHFSLYICAT